MRLTKFFRHILLNPRKVLLIIKVKLLTYLYFIQLQFQNPQDDFVFVTAADTTHFKSVIQFFTSLLTYEKESIVIFYDLGLSDQEKNIIRKSFPVILYERFDYSKFPGYFQINVNAGEYAWKP